MFSFLLHKIMLHVIELVFFVNSVAFGSLDRPIQPLLDGSKFVNTFKTQKDPSVQDDVSVRWPNGIVRYYLDEQSYDSTFGEVMYSVIKIIERSSCIQFTRLQDKPLDNETWIHITNSRKERECKHEPRFMDRGEIELVFGYDCLKTKEILHTLLHGIGIKDEVTHPHRDKYIRVFWDNIHPAYQHLYRKQVAEPSKTLVEYDPLSVMQFHDRAFSRNGHATVVPLEPGLLISPSETLSQLDKMRIQMYFGHECNKRKASNLLKTCKKFFTASEGSENHEEKDIPDTNNYESDYGAEKENTNTINTENQSIEEEESNMENKYGEDFDAEENNAIKQEGKEQDEDKHYEDDVEDVNRQDEEESDSKNTEEVNEVKEDATKDTNTTDENKTNSVKNELPEGAFENNNTENASKESVEKQMSNNKF